MSRARRFALVAACVAVPPLLLCLVAALQGFYPFGTMSFLSSDLAQQYVDLYAWLRRVLTGQASLLYSWGISLGSNMWGNFSYYLSSPLNLLLPLFPEDKIALFVFVTDAIKLSLTQLSTCWFVRRRFGLSGPWAFALALGFCFSTWSVSMLRNPMWLDAVYLMPLAMYGCWRYVREGRWGLLLATLAADVMICWYMAYMSIVFLCLYVLLEAYLLHLDSPGLGWRWYLGRVLGFAGVIAGALLLSAWTFLPTVVQMLGTENAGGLPVQPSLRYLIAGLFPGTLLVDVTPQLFFGSLALLLGAAYLFDAHAGLRRRLALLLVLVLLAAACVVVPLGMVFTGFRLPDGFYCRFSWLFGLMLLWAAGAELASLHEGAAPRRQVLASLLALSVTVAYVAWKGLFGRLRYLAACEVSLVAFAVFVLLVYGRRRPGTRAIALGLACVLACVELVPNARLAWSRIYTDGLTQAANDAYVAASTEDLAKLRKADSGAYRMDKTFTRWGNSFDEGLAQGYAALSGYTSVNNGRLFDLLDTLGVTGTPSHYLTRYVCPVPPTDSLFGLKYVFCTSNPPGYEATSIADGSRGYQVFRNPHALSLGFGVSGDVSRLTLDAGDDRDPFANQNALLTALLGHDAQVWKPVDVTLQEIGKTGNLHWTVSSGEESNTYIYLTNNPDDVTMTVSLHDGGLTYSEFDFSRHGIFLLGGGTQEVYVMPSGSVASNVRLLAYELDMDAYEAAVDELAQHQLAVTSFQDGRLTGTYDADADGTLLTTVPYDEGWTVRVDGERVDYTATVDDALIAVPVHAGHNEVELTYMPRGLIAGCVISVATGGGLAVARVLRRRRQAA